MITFGVGFSVGRLISASPLVKHLGKRSNRIDPKPNKEAAKACYEEDRTSRRYALDHQQVLGEKFPTPL